MAQESRVPLLKNLLLGGTLHKHPKKQVIQTTEKEGDFHLIKRGYIKRYLISNTGAIGVQVVYGPGDFFSVTQVYKKLFDRDINRGPETYYYEAITDVEIYSISIKSVAQHALKTPDIYKDLLLLTGERLYSTLQGVESTNLRSSYHRIAHQLLYLAARFGLQTANGVRIAIPVTHQDIAELLGITRETVSMGIVELRDKGLIKTKRSIVIPDIAKLVEEAYT